MEALLMLLTDPNARWVLFGCMLLGISSGVLGCFAVLRRHSLLGDAVAHAALPGICVAFLITGTKSTLPFMLGAALVGWLATWCIGFITRHSRIKEDTALGVVLTVFFGIGVLMLTGIQHTAGGNQSGLDSFLFGKAASMVFADVQVMMIAAGVLLLLCLLLFKEFKLLSFDPGFGRGVGLPIGVLNGLLMLMIVTAVVIGLQAVGVVLMAAMLITPALAARCWTERLDRMVLLSGLFGALSGAVGTFASSVAQNMPTGPVIVLAATLLFLLSLIFAPRRGLLIKGLELARLRSKVAQENVLQSLYDLMERKSRGRDRAFTLDELLQRRPQTKRNARRALTLLQKKGWLHSESSDHWKLTEAGIEEARRLTLNQRVLEILQMYEGQLGTFRLDPQRGNVSDQLPADILDTVRRLLVLHGLEPTLTRQGGERR